MDVGPIRQQFPILSQSVHGKSLVYLDSAASTQKPKAVIDAVSNYYTNDHANVHRGVHALSQRATSQYEYARDRVVRFLGAEDSRQVVFTRGTTEAINLVAQAWGRAHVGKGDEIIISHMEHHSNIVPWQLLAESVGAVLRVIPMDNCGILDLDRYAEMLNERTRIVSVVHLSNVLGTLNPVKKMVEMAHQVGAKVLVDGAQSVAHMDVSVEDLGCDFYAFSGHKVYGPTGIGVLYGKWDVLEDMPPFQGGGEMIDRVQFEGSTYAPPPARFEAGTPHVAGAIGLCAALEWLSGLDSTSILAHEKHLLAQTASVVASIPGAQIMGDPNPRLGVLPFVIDGLHPYDIGAILDREGVAVRTGHHCAQPTMAHFGVTGTVRASFGVYNNEEDVERFSGALKKAVQLLRP